MSDTGIPSASELLDLVGSYVEDPERPLQSQDRPVRLATIDPSYAGVGNPKVTFDGETTMGTRTYVWIGRKPIASERVVMVPVGHTYVVVGTIGDLTLQPVVTPDTGWVQITTFVNSFTAAENVYYRNIDGLVHLRGALYNAVAPTAEVQAFTLPSGSRPGFGKVFLGTIATWAAHVSITTAGLVLIQANTARTSGQGYPINGLCFRAS